MGWQLLCQFRLVASLHRVPLPWNILVRGELKPFQGLGRSLDRDVNMPSCNSSQGSSNPNVSFMVCFESLRSDDLWGLATAEHKQNWQRLSDVIARVLALAGEGDKS